MLHLGRVAAGCAAALHVALAAGNGYGETPVAADAQEIFDRYAPLVAQIEVVDRGSGTKSSIGSAFATGPTDAGRVATNFHVIADVVHEPERYRAVLLSPDGARHEASVVAIDVIRDLALVTSAHRFDGGLEIRHGAVANGERIYSLGNPYDIGLSIVEGTYNGLLGHSLEDKIHFTGSLNPGMSGGPALDAKGALVGVNVATSGNQVSFLVPAAALGELLATPGAQHPSTPSTAALRAAIGEQIRRFQRRYAEAVLASPAQQTHLGRALAPTRPAPFFNCWGEVRREDELRYQTRTHECGSDDAIFLSRRITIVPFEIRHRQLETRSLSARQFFATYSNFFEANHSEKWGSRRDFTAFRCRTRFVNSGGSAFKTSFCARRYLDYADLFDVVFKVALLGHRSAGIESALVLSGVEFANARRLAARHLEGIAWSE